ncbi:unnamed protein product [Blepharisma stoltei]|uniref:Uncharacterized protein n=1 Tax=Blepharisma stoltei TaxID=1481888 RepID=A0AAU9IF04_9CILI|nr:unnamed protein product [Blepharisma stoltei]
MNILHNWCLRCFSSDSKEAKETIQLSRRESQPKVEAENNVIEKQIEIDSPQLDKTCDPIADDSKSSELKSPLSPQEIELPNGQTIEIKIKQAKKKKKKKKNIKKNPEGDRKESEVSLKIKNRKRTSFAERTEPPRRPEPTEDLPQRRVNRFKTVISPFKDQSSDVLKIRSFIKSFGTAKQEPQQQQMPTFLEHL